MMESQDDLTPDEQESLRRLPREAASPPALEDATVAALHGRGLLRRSQPRGIHPVLAIAASLLLFAGGLAIGRVGTVPSLPDDGRPRFAFFLYEGPEYQQPAPGAMAQRVGEYVAWASEKRANGVVEGGEKLKEDADFAVGEAVASAGQPRLAGYFLVRATDRSAAAEIARSCPHVRYGGSIVIREIDPT
jgi:hypothetical protein